MENYKLIILLLLITLVGSVNAQVKIDNSESEEDIISIQTPSYPSYNNETSGSNVTNFPHNLLANLAWSVAGHTIDTNINWNNYNLTNIERLGIGIVNAGYNLHVVGTGYFTGSVYPNFLYTLSSGIESSPVYSFNNDPNTGMWNPSADVLAFSTNGDEKLRMNNSGSYFDTNVSIRGSLIVDKNITASYFFGDGSGLTGISSAGQSIQLKNNSLASGNTYLLTNTTWNSVNSVINNIRITTECLSMNMSICTDSGCTSEDVLYAERYKNASTYGSYTYMNADNKAGVYVKYYCNSGADTSNIYLGGVTA